MLAVMSVVSARAKHPSKRWPSTIQSVVKQGCEFSYRCDNSMKRNKDPLQWERAQQLAWWYLSGGYDDEFNAQYYHKRGVSPQWSKSEKYVGRVGSHLFYSCVSKYC